MDPPNWQGGDPNGRGAYYPAYFTAQRLNHNPSSSSRPQQYQPQGAYPRSFGVGISTNGNISGWVAPRTSRPNVIDSQYQYRYQYDSATVFPAYGNSSSAIPYGYGLVNPPGAGDYARRPGSAAAIYAPGYNNNNPPQYASVYDPYTSAGLVAPPANANQGARSRGPVAGDPNQSRMANDLLDEVRRANTPGDFEAIIDHVIRNHRNGFPLMEVAEPMVGEIALKTLVRLTALLLHPEALQRLFRCLIDGWIMEQSNGPELLVHFFTTLHFHQCSIFILELALPRFWEMVATPRFGHMSMIMRLELDTEQVTALQETFVFRTYRIARNMNGFNLLRTIFEIGRNYDLQELIRQRVLANLVELSMDRFGNNVVLSCFVPGGSGRMTSSSAPLLERGLQAFFYLPDQRIRELVQNCRGRYVLHRLLSTSAATSEASSEATLLANQILRIGADGPRRRGDPRAQAIAILRP